MADKKDQFVIVRVTAELKEKLVKKAGGARKLSAFARSLFERAI